MNKLLIIPPLIILLALLVAYFVPDNSTINMLRRDSGLYGLHHNPILDMSAQARAEDIVKTGNFSHDGFSSVIGHYYGSTVFKAETLSRYTSGPFTHWMISESHKSVMLSKYTCEYGLGQYGYVHVLHLGCK